MLTFIDWFAGIGGFRRGMEMAGHRCVGFCEFDKYAVASYTSMHCITDEQRAALAEMDLKKRRKEILKDEYRNGEWFADDVVRVIADDIPRADVWCFGFPCQDISVAGKQRGFKGNRSSLFFRVTGLLAQLKEEDRPHTLFIENVRNLLSVNRGFDFARLLVELASLGYDASWDILNSKDFGVPQNRERCFIVGYLGGGGGREVFPLRRDASQNGSQQKIIKVGSGIPVQQVGVDKSENQPQLKDIANCITAREDRGVSKQKQEGTAVVVFDKPIACPIATVGRAYKNQNGRRVKGNNEDMFTLTAQDIHGVIDDKYRIRKLTPKECFRLQGWTDEYFERAAFVNTDTQLYKQAGNGVTVPVIYQIAKRLA